MIPALRVRVHNEGPCSDAENAMRQVLARRLTAVLVMLSGLMYGGGCAPQILMTPRERGDSMVSHGFYGGALYWYGRAIEKDANDVAAYVGRAQARSQMVHFDAWPADRPKADFPGALADYDRAVALQPTNSMIYANRSVVRAVTGQYAGAMSDVETAMRLNPKDASLHGYRGMILLRMGRDAEAQTEFDTCTKLLPI